MWLLSVVAIGGSGCHRTRVAALLSAPECAQIHAAVLITLRTERAALITAPIVVLDTLAPSTALESDMHEKVLSTLSIDRGLLDRYLAAQQPPSGRVSDQLWQDARWTFVAPRTLDTLRATARNAAVHDSTAAPARTASPNASAKRFWQLWDSRYPASHGYIALSPAGVSRDGAAVLIQVRAVCGPVCGTTDLHLLRRSADGGWRVTARVRLAES
jgi:hypothetical protein